MTLAAVSWGSLRSFIPFPFYLYKHSSKRACCLKLSKKNMGMGKDSSGKALLGSPHQGHARRVSMPGGEALRLRWGKQQSLHEASLLGRERGKKPPAKPPQWLLQSPGLFLQPNKPSPTSRAFGGTNRCPTGDPQPRHPGCMELFLHLRCSTHANAPAPLREKRGLATLALRNELEGNRRAWQAGKGLGFAIWIIHLKLRKQLGEWKEEGRKSNE